MRKEIAIFSIMKKLVYDVGYNDSILIRDKNAKLLKSYVKWNDMLRRCYSIKFHIMNPTYIGCTVCDEWKLYSNFKKWFDDNYIEGYELDKDIIIDGNKVYSPDKCCFIPHYLNTLFTDSNKSRGLYALGVYFDTQSNKYKSQILLYGKTYNLGRFNSESEAHNAWLIAKREYARKLAITAYMNNEIDERIMNAIIKKAYNLK